MVQLFLSWLNFERPTSGIISCDLALLLLPFFNPLFVSLAVVVDVVVAVVGDSFGGGPYNFLEYGPASSKKISTAVFRAFCCWVCRSSLRNPSRLFVRSEFPEVPDEGPEDLFKISPKKYRLFDILSPRKSIVTSSLLFCSTFLRSTSMGWLWRAADRGLLTWHDALVWGLQQRKRKVNFLFYELKTLSTLYR